MTYKLLFIYQKGCGACHDARPHFNKVVKQLSAQLIGRAVDMDTEKFPFPIVYTPTFCFIIPNSIGRKGGYFVTDPVKLGGDAVTADVLLKWMQECLNRYKAM